MADNRVAYGLAKKHGIDTTGMSPAQVWDALKEKGVSLGADREAEQTRLKEKYFDKADGKTYRKPIAKGFNRSNTRSHLAHAKEMGLNEKEYVRAATEFFNSGKGKMYINPNNKRCYRYDAHTQLLCICDSSGQVLTFFQPKNKKHFEKLIKQFELEEI